MIHPTKRLFCLSVCCGLLCLAGCSGSSKPKKQVELRPPGKDGVQQASYVTAIAPGYLPPAAAPRRWRGSCGRSTSGPNSRRRPRR